MTTNLEMTALKTKAVRYALIWGVIVFGIKLLGYILTGSVSVLSDALESTVNVATAGLTAWAIHIASRPPDASHPYGHDKAEYISSVIEGALIGMAAVLIFATARESFINPQPITAPVPGLIVTSIASLINLILGRYLIQTSQKAQSIALETDGRHILADVITSVGVLIGVILSVTSGLWWLDPLIAVLVGLNIIWAAILVMRKSVNGLMDPALSTPELETIRVVLNSFKERYIEIHDLRSRSSGPRRFVDFHMILPEHTTVLEAHDLCDEIETALMSHMPNASVTIHVEPTAFRLGNKTAVRF